MVNLEFHSQVIFGSPVATFAIDKNHRITHWNRACEALTGLPATEMVGTDLQWKAFYAQQRVVLADLIVRDTAKNEILALYGGRGRRSALVDSGYEAEGFFPDLGRQGKWLFFTAAPIKDRKGGIIGAVETLQDISARKFAEEKVHNLNRSLERLIAEQQQSLELLRSTQRQLVQAEKMAALGNLVAGVAHEINTPVGIGVTAASLLEERTREAAGRLRAETMKRSDLEAYFRLASESATIILANLKRASDLIQSFKQVAVDRSSETPRTVHLQECLDNLLLSLRPILRKTSHSVRVQCPAELVLHSYPGALGQVLSNLVQNSLLHGFDAREEGAIDIEVQASSEQVEICYRDNGRGIAAEHLPLIFEPFFTTRRNNGGTGLGLNILYNLVTRTLRGVIECSSQPGDGAVFRIRIPRVIPLEQGSFPAIQPAAEQEEQGGRG